MSAVVIGACYSGCIGVVLCAGVLIGMSLGSSVGSDSRALPIRRRAAVFSRPSGARTHRGSGRAAAVFLMGEILFRTRLSNRCVEGSHVAAAHPGTV